LFKLLFALLVGVGMAAGCSVDNADKLEGTCSGLSCGDLPGQSDAQEYEIPPAQDAAAPPVLPAKDACGMGSCLPDDVAACPASPQGAGGGGSMSTSDAGLSSDAGLDAGEGLDAGLDGGAVATQLDGSFPSPTPTPPAPSRYGCQVSVTVASGVERICGAAGTQGVDDACTSSRDCEPGLGCVGTVRSGRCLPFCCAIGPDTCRDGSYCAERPLRDETFGEAPGPLVPVCDRADDCSLGEPDNCTGPSCVCGPETACTLVRTDGTTACVKPGEGIANEDCPCARGYQCSQATTPPMCVKTCDLDEAKSQTCFPGVCQATPLLPDGWGICVGATPNQMIQR